MKPEDFVERIKQALPDQLRSVILYGSAAAGDHIEKSSDYNILLVADSLTTKELRAIAKPTRAWTRAGNPAPLMFTLDRLKRSADVFPIEILDMKQSHRILHGDDILPGIEVSRENLRLELEHELKGKLIQLRVRYLDTGGKPKLVAELMAQSLSTFLVLMRGTLRLFVDDVPRKKMDVIDALAERIELDWQIFRTIDKLRTSSLKARDIEPDQLFEQYLTSLEQLVDSVDSFIHKKGEKK